MSLPLGRLTERHCPEQGAFKRFMRGLEVAHEAGLAMRINRVLSRHKRAIADRYGIPSFEYTNITPTIHGTGEVLPSQANEVLRRHDPYTGCSPRPAPPLGDGREDRRSPVVRGQSARRPRTVIWS
jgi:hypothetical protein